jgi:hypothetical protein
VAHRLKEIAMNPAASPRHPWKALAAVLAMSALVHGAGAHVFSHDHDSTHVHVVHQQSFDEGDDCPDVDDHFGPGFPFDDGPDDGAVVDVLDDDWS